MKRKLRGVNVLGKDVINIMDIEELLAIKQGTKMQIRQVLEMEYANLRIVKYSNGDVCRIEKINTDGTKQPIQAKYKVNETVTVSKGINQLEVKIECVYLERLQDITPFGLYMEGLRTDVEVLKSKPDNWNRLTNRQKENYARMQADTVNIDELNELTDLRDVFAKKWDADMVKRYGTHAYDWERNPWVWVYMVKVI